MSSARKPRRLIGSIAFETPAGAVFGDTRIRLLEAIAEQGSLNKAAKAVPLSYKAAWDALDAMNNLAESPLVVRTTGGRNGGGTQLTEHGRQMIALYRAMERSQQDILDQVSAPRTLANVPQDDTALRTLLRRMAVKTSARNQFVGRVVSIADAGGMADVRLQLEGGDELVAAITPESVETMALKRGSQVYALIKAPWVGVSLKAPRRNVGGHSARNAYEGTITAIDAGRTSTRLTLTTDGGRTVAAAMPHEKVIERGLVLAFKRGLRAWASFSTESVILATFE